jgi:hypothetical protein
MIPPSRVLRALALAVLLGRSAYGVTITLNTGYTDATRTVSVAAYDNTPGEAGTVSQVLSTSRRRTR